MKDNSDSSSSRELTQAVFLIKSQALDETLLSSQFVSAGAPAEAKQMSGSNCGSLCCMSVSQPILLTAGNINIPAPPFIYLAHLLLYSSGQDLIANLFLSPPTKSDWWLADTLHQGVDTLMPGLLMRQPSSGCWGHRHPQNFRGCNPSQGERWTPLLPSQGQSDWLTEEVLSCYGRRDAPCSSLPAVQLDWAELSARSLCAVISWTGNPKCRLLQVHDWCMMMYMIDAISHRWKNLV